MCACVPPQPAWLSQAAALKLPCCGFQLCTWGLLAAFVLWTPSICTASQRPHDCLCCAVLQSIDGQVHKHHTQDITTVLHTLNTTPRHHMHCQQGGNCLAPGTLSTLTYGSVQRTTYSVLFWRSTHVQRCKAERTGRTAERTEYPCLPDTLQ